MALGSQRLLAGAVGLALTSTVMLAVPAAASTQTAFYPTTWAYTDSAAPASTFVAPSGDAPIGARTNTDGSVHTTRAYFTYNLSAVAGNLVNQAMVYTSETTVADCAKPEDTQVWLTDTATAPTWNQSPAEQAQLLGPRGNAPCASKNVAWEATDAIKAAAAAGRSSVTLEMRLPAADEADPAFARTFAPSIMLSIDYNRVPLAPTNLGVYVSGNSATACGATPLLLGGNFTYGLTATATDPDTTDTVHTEFDWWPVDHPDQVTSRQSPRTSSGQVGVSIDRSELVDGVTYAWKARSSDAQATGPWSGVCQFVTDQTNPNAPTVSSADYPADSHIHGGSGLPGTFTFNANGSSDVVGFRYGLNDPTAYVAADHGSASIVITPDNVGPFTLTVQSVDAAGNYSQSTRYSYLVGDNEPKLSCTPAEAYRNTARTCIVTPHDSTDTGYTYQLDNGSAVDLPAGPDGTATFSVTPADSDVKVNVRAKLSNGNLTGPRSAYLYVDPGAPIITTSADEVVGGQPLQATFKATLPGSTTFTYTWKVWDGGEPITVPVGPDGTATVSLPTDTLGYEGLDVYSTAADGHQSATAETTVLVDNGPPTVTSTDYPQNQWGGGVGIAGKFTFASAASNVVSYTYWFNNDDPVTVPAGPDGTATVSITPTQNDGQSQLVLVAANLADGSQTDLTRYGFFVKATPSA